MGECRTKFYTERIEGRAFNKSLVELIWWLIIATKAKLIMLEKQAREEKFSRHLIGPVEIQKGTGLANQNAS